MALVVCQSCETHNKDLENKDPIILDGYWSSNRISNGIHNRPFILFSNDAKASFLTPKNQIFYVIEDDELAFYDEFDSTKIMVFEITGYDKTQLKLKSVDNNTIETVKEFGRFTNSDLLSYLVKKTPSLDTLHFYRLEKHNKKFFTEITFRCGPCGSGCDISYIKIKNTGEVLFYGVNDGHDVGGYVGTLDHIEYLNNVINLLPLSQINKKYKAPWTDDQECKLKIDFSDGTSIETSVYGFNEEPIELRTVLYELMSLPELLDLKPSKNVSPNSFVELGEPFVVAVSED